MDADAKLIAQAASRTIAAANAGDDSSCRWCGGTNCCHELSCPIITLIDIVMYFASKTDEDKDLARERLAARRDLALKLRDCAPLTAGEICNALVKGSSWRLLSHDRNTGEATVKVVMPWA